LVYIIKYFTFVASLNKYNMDNQTTENLELIQKMIKTAQRRFADNSNFYLLWGFAIFFACVMQYILIKLKNPNNSIGWLIVIPLAMVLQILFVLKKKKEEKVRTHIESLMGKMWIAFGITLGIVLSFASHLQENTYPIILCLYAISAFVAGGALQLTSLYIGAICCWILAIVSFFVPFEIQLLLLAAAVIVAYVIPGLIIKSAYRNNQNV